MCCDNDCHLTWIVPRRLKRCYYTFRNPVPTTLCPPPILPFICFRPADYSRLMRFLGLQLITLMSPTQRRQSHAHVKHSVTFVGFPLILNLLLFKRNTLDFVPFSTQFLHFFLISISKLLHPLTSSSSRRQRVSNKLTSTPSIGPLQKRPLGWDLSAPGLTPAWGQQWHTHTHTRRLGWGKTLTRLDHFTL